MIVWTKSIALLAIVNLRHMSPCTTSVPAFARQTAIAGDNNVITPRCVDVKSLQRTDGSFCGDEWGEVDTRCAVGLVVVLAWAYNATVKGRWQIGYRKL